MSATSCTVRKRTSERSRAIVLRVSCDWCGSCGWSALPTRVGPRTQRCPGTTTPVIAGHVGRWSHETARGLPQLAAATVAAGGEVGDRDDRRVAALRLADPRP